MATETVQWSITPPTNQDDKYNDEQNETSNENSEESGGNSITTGYNKAYATQRRYYFSAKNSLCVFQNADCF